jgi:hypothetical protein
MPKLDIESRSAPEFFRSALSLWLIPLLDNLPARLTPSMIVMDEGVIVATGRTKEILADQRFLNEHGLEKPRCRVRFARVGYCIKMVNHNLEEHKDFLAFRNFG